MGDIEWWFIVRNTLGRWEDLVRFFEFHMVEEKRESGGGILKTLEEKLHSKANFPFLRIVYLAAS